MRATLSGWAVMCVALDREQQDDREQQPVERDRRDARDEGRLEPLAAVGAQTPAAREVAGRQRDAEEDEGGPRDLPDADVEALVVQAEQVGQGVEVEPAEQRVGDDLEDRVEDDQHGGAVVVAAGQVIPDEDHRDAAGKADDDDAGAIRGLVGEEQPREREHERRPDDPGHEQRDAEHAAVAAHVAEVLVADLGKDRVHHQQEAERRSAS